MKCSIEDCIFRSKVASYKNSGLYLCGRHKKYNVFKSKNLDEVKQFRDTYMKEKFECEL